MRRIRTTIRIILQKYLSLKKYPQVFLSETFSKEYMVNALSGDRFEIESYKEIYPAKLEPNRTLYDPERNKMPA
jgi:hypothetical protein